MRTTTDVIAARSMGSVNGGRSHGVGDVFVIREDLLNGTNVVKEGRAVTVDKGVAIHDIFGIAGSARRFAILKTVGIEVTVIKVVLRTLVLICFRRCRRAWSLSLGGGGV